MDFANKVENKKFSQKRKSFLQFSYGCAFSVAALLIIDNLITGSISAEMSMFAIMLLHLLRMVLFVIAAPVVFLALHWWLYRQNPKYFRTAH